MRRKCRFTNQYYFDSILAEENLNFDMVKKTYSLYISSKCKPICFWASQAIRIANTNMLVYKKARRPNANHHGANGQCKLLWTVGHVGFLRVLFSLGMYISNCLSRFCWRWFLVEYGLKSQIRRYILVSITSESLLSFMEEY